MNEKKNNGFAALILSLIVVVVAVLAVKFAGGTAASAVKPAPGPEVTPGGDETPAGKYGVGTYTSTSKGFGGDVTVTITIAEGDVIADVVIKGDAETAALGGVAMEKLAAKIKDTQSVEVDAMTGATFTSKAVIAAAADCMAQAEAAAGSAGEGEAAGAYKPGTYTASSKGFGGDVVATVVIGEDGAIAEVSFVGAAETAALGGVALEKLPAKFVDAQSAEVDTMSGATFTSKAAIAAVADCLAQAAN